VAPRERYGPAAFRDAADKHQGTGGPAGAPRIKHQNRAGAPGDEELIDLTAIEMERLIRLTAPPAMVLLVEERLLLVGCGR
jgi:hypothetical protein